MNKSLRRELAAMAGIAAVACLGTKSKVLSGIFAAGAAGLVLSTLKKDYSFKGKSAYITGGSRGFGLSLAWNLLKQGASVTLVARDRNELQNAREILIKDFPKAEIYLSVCDVTDRKQLHSSLDQAIHRMSGIDLLINNAGAILVGPFTSMEKEDFESQMRLHLYAAIESTQLLLPHFKSRGGGKILNVCSLGGKVAVPHMLAYDASKFALAGFSQGVGAELARFGVCVTTVYPTVMRTGSPIQAVFKGNHEKEFAWFETIDHMPMISMSADMAAKKTLAAVRDGQTEVILSWPGKLRMFMGTVFPETMNLLMDFANRLMPTEDSKVRKTGSESSKLFKKIPLLETALGTAEHERTYNQIARKNAKVSMGIKH